MTVSEKTTKVCACCKAEKPVDAFSLNTIPKKNGDVSLRSYCKACRIAKQKVIQARHRAKDSIAVKHRDWKRHILQRYGLTYEKYSEMLIAQNGMCAICNEAGEGSLAVDHCHRTGKVRGLLCRPCNSALGQLGESIANVYQALLYLIESKSAVEYEIDPESEWEPGLKRIIAGKVR